MSQQTTDPAYMQRALSLAERGRLTVAPNPMVGCVIVRDGQIVGEGYHQRAGEAHAEVHALQDAGEKARGAHVFVTLEPCCHHGRTPPCSDALIHAGVSAVTIASLDANPLVARLGAQQLRDAGIDVSVGLCEQQALQLNEIYFHYQKTKRPFVIAKWAMSLDGQTSTHPNDQRQISSAASNEQVHRTRSLVDAIMIGAQTARCDNPLLTTRLENIDYKHPLRIIVTGKGDLSLDLRLFDKTLPNKTMVITTALSDESWRQQLMDKNITVQIMPHNQQGDIELDCLLDALGEQGITSILVEGGRTLHQQFFAANLVDKVDVYIAPTIIANYPQKKCLYHASSQRMGDDMVFSAYLRSQ